MPLVNVKCPNCGAKLQAESTKDALICPFCHEAYIVEKAMNNYISNQNDIHANVVNIFGGDTSDFVIRAGVLEKYKGASDKPIIPNGVTIIGRKAFAHCIGLTEVTIPDSVTLIGQEAFTNCTRLAHVTIPDSVTEIGDDAFLECGGLESVDLGHGVKRIGDGAFQKCTFLHEIVIPESVERLGYGAFQECWCLLSVTICNFDITFYGNCFKKCMNLKTVISPGGIMDPADDRFSFEETPWYNKRHGTNA